MASKALVLIAALMVGAISALPIFLGYFNLGENYELFSKWLISPIAFDEVAAYAPQASYFKENLRLPFETEVKEFSKTPNVKYHLPIFIEGVIQYLSQSTRLGWTFVKLIFPAISFILAFWISKELSGNFGVGIFAATAFSTIGFGARTIFNIGDQDLQPILFSRINSPAITLPFLLLFIISLMKVYESRIFPFRDGIKTTIFCGIAAGLLFYVYYYYQVAAIGLITAIFLWNLGLKNWGLAKRIFFVGLIANITAIPWYAIYLKSISQSGGFISKWQPHSYRPSLGNIILLTALSCLVLAGFALRKRAIEGGSSNRYKPLVFLIFASIFIEIIISPIRPIILEPSHFTQQITIGFGLLLSISLLGEIVFGYEKLNKKWLTAFVTAAVILLMGITAIKQVSVWENSKQYFISSEEERAVENLIEKNTAKKDVIAIYDPYLSSAMPARIWRFRFYGFAGSTDVSSRENVERYIFIKKMFGDTWEKVEKELRGEDAASKLTSGVSTVPMLLTFKKILSEQEIKNGEKFYDTVDSAFLKEKELDYILVTGNQNENFLQGADLLKIGAEKAGDEDEAIIYRVKRKG